MKFPWQKKEAFFTDQQQHRLLEAIQWAEQKTSGEVRLFIESRCRFVDPMDRAVELFLELGMQNTKNRNATLIYLAVKDHQAAILGDEGIHKKVGTEYWNKEVSLLISNFNSAHYGEGISECVKDIGEALHHYFPFDNDTDKNELPDEIIFGK